MSDIVPPEVRSRMMAGIRGKDTKPELCIRKSLHARGFRFRVHDKRLAGKPDLVFSKWRAVIFVQGCFWHGHECTKFKWPSTRGEFWKKKINDNRTRDVVNVDALSREGWRVGLVWECALRRFGDSKVIEIIVDWLLSDKILLELSEEDVFPVPSKGGRVRGLVR